MQIIESNIGLFRYFQVWLWYYFLPAAAGLHHDNLFPPLKNWRQA
jgi:hypothetical protein